MVAVLRNKSILDTIVTWDKPLETSDLRMKRRGGVSRTHGAEKIRLQQVTPASAFCNSDTSTARMGKPFRSSVRAVSGKDAAIMTVPFNRRTFAAPPSLCGTSI